MILPFGGKTGQKMTSSFKHMEPVILGMSALISTILIPFIGKFCNIITNNS